MLGTDATGLLVLDPEAREHIRTAAMWCWTNARWVSFAFTPSADSASIRRFLGDDLARTVQCDGTNTLTFIENAGGRRPGCWSHGRRRFAEAARGGDLLALDPRAYLHRVTTLIVEGWPDQRRRELLPDRIAVLFPELDLDTTSANPA